MANSSSSSLNSQDDEIQWIEPPEVPGPSGMPQQSTSPSIVINGKKKTKKKNKRYFTVATSGDANGDKTGKWPGRVVGTLRNATKRRLSKGEQRAHDIRKRKQEQFLKMLFTPRTTLTPWTDVEEVKEVHRSIYSSLNFEVKDFGESEYGKRLAIQSGTGAIESLCFARDKLSAWKFRCRNIVRSQIIMSHLTSLESILNVLIEEHNFNHSKRSDGVVNSSMIYSLYSIGVINYCNALTSYPSEYNIDITVRNLAELFECPNWIVSCRHLLSHPTSNPPTLGILSEAIAFALEWMDRFFWSKAICGQFNFSSTHTAKPSQQQQDISSTSQVRSGSPTKGSNSFTLNFGPPKPLVSKEQIHHETCLLLFTTCPNKRMSIKKNIQQYMLLNPNQYIRTFCEILVFGVPIHETLSMNSFTLPQLLLRRSSRIFALIFSALPADQMLILLLNQLLDQIVITERMCATGQDDHQEYHRKAKHSGLCWLWAIVEAVTIPVAIVNVKDDEDRRRTIFQKSFDLFGDLSALKRRHTFTWIRMLYRICKLKLNRNTNKLAELFYYLIDRDVMPVEKFHLIVNMIDIYTEDSLLMIASSTEVNQTNSKTQMKTLDDLKKAVCDNSKQATVKPIDDTASIAVYDGPQSWHIPIGSSLKSLIPFGEENNDEEESVADQQKYMVDDEDNRIEKRELTLPSTNKVEMITID